MKRTLLIPTLILLCTFIAGAQSADAILDKVVGRLETAPSLTMRMTLSGDGMNQSATLTMSKEKFAYTIGALSVFYDGTTQWTVDNSEREISLTEPTADELVESNPLAFVRNYKKKYRAQLISQTKQTATIRMTTTDKSAYVRTADVVVDLSTLLPTRVDARLATGQSLRINITSSAVGQPLAPSTFRADTSAYPRYEVIDLR